MRRRVTARDFTIISNDCFGGMAYEEMGMRYDTPFVDCFSRSKITCGCCGG